MNKSTTSSMNNQTVNCGFVAGSCNPAQNGFSGEATGCAQAPERSDWLKDPRNLKRLVKSIGASNSCTSHLSDENLAYFNYSMEELKRSLVADTWRSLEKGRSFKANDKIALITEDTLVVGIDVAAYKYDLRAFDRYGTELTVTALEYSQSRDGFDQGINAMYELAVLYGKKNIVVGCEPTGHYWFNLYFDLIKHGITVVTVNPYAVNRTKEIDDNLQVKSDAKDPKVISQLVRDGHFSVPYLPEGDFAEARNYANLFQIATEDHCTWRNRLHRWCDIHWPELKAVYSNDICSSGCLEILGRGLTPKAILEMGKAGVEQVFVDMKARGARAKKAEEIYNAAQCSIGLEEGINAAMDEAKYIVEHIRSADNDRFKFQEKMTQYALQVYPNLDNIAQIGGITLKTSARFVADLGDVSRFGNAAEIVKLSGLCPVISQSGKWKGIPKISKRGRKRLRATLYVMADNVVRYDNEFKDILTYYTTRAENPMKRKEALMVVCNKLTRLIVHLLRSGETYDPAKLRNQIKRFQASAKEGAVGATPGAATKGNTSKGAED